MTLRLPDPARFALHKLIVSQKRPLKKADKAAKDLQQAVAVIDMLIGMGQAQRLNEIASGLPKGWRSIMRQAVGVAREKGLIGADPRLDRFFTDWPR
jgi:hypothetical protein